MFFKKAVTCILCTGILVLTSVPAVAGTAPARIYVNNREVSIPPGDQAPFIEGGRTYVPLRIIAEKLGALVEWRQDTRQVVITSGDDNSYAVPPRTGKNTDVEIVVNGEALNIPPSYGKARITAAGRTVVPLRAVGEALGCEVHWVQATRVVEIKSLTFKLLEDLAAYRSNLRLLDGRVVNSSELPAMGEEAFSPAQVQEFKKMLELLAPYKHEIKLPGGTVIKTADLTIMGEPILTADDLKAWMAKETPRIAEMMRREGREMLPIPDELPELYIKIGKQYGVRGDLAFAQAVKETRYFQFTGSVKAFQNNYCGLWATSQPLTGQESLNGADPSAVSLQPGLYGATFASPAIGVEAHIQHLYAYATKEPLPPGKTLYDPRFNLVQRGSAQRWVELNARWAVPGTTYGQSIIQDYWLRALSSNR
ncbi:stalk domain-containing protein [Thermanaeromonas sp. C210]|uniref:stalk domain-containing protein n=1 Tax=Thermanaeromonas sp. C210 TaxID=2731925 RepID=UPI00155C31D8|nr:stalk domain-containing protein [Thermanaeromonas sp. C210]GFN23807.1 copper amine oxidase [Thermanaeromonas sp. C210]